MTTALRSTDLPQEPSQMERDLRSARVRNATLRRELVRLVAAPTVVGVRVIDEMLTATLSTGAVIQRRPFVIDTAEEFGYGFKWVALDPIPDTPAAVVAEAFADDENLPAELFALPQSIGHSAEQHHDADFRTLARLALGGMAVSAGDQS